MLGERRNVASDSNRGLRGTSGLSGLAPVVANDQVVGVERPPGVRGSSTTSERLATQLATSIRRA